MSDNWKRSHWNRDKISVQKVLTTSQLATVFFTNDERRIPLCVMWKQDGIDLWHVRGITDEFAYEFAEQSISRARDYVESLLEQIKNESNS